MSKGSGKRPQYISEQQMQDNWDKLFPKIKKKHTKLRSRRK